MNETRQIHTIAKCRRHGGRRPQLGCRFNHMMIMNKGIFYARGLFLSSFWEDNGFTCTLSGCVATERAYISFSKSYPRITISAFDSGHLLKYLIYQLCLRLIQWKKQPFGLAYYRLQKQGHNSLYMDKTFKIVAKCIHKTQCRNKLDIYRGYPRWARR
jgi:hypothetical protein